MLTTELKLTEKESYIEKVKVRKRKREILKRERVGEGGRERERTSCAFEKRKRSSDDVAANVLCLASNKRSFWMTICSGVENVRKERDLCERNPSLSLSLTTLFNIFGSGGGRGDEFSMSFNTQLIQRSV